MRLRNLTMSVLINLGLLTSSYALASARHHDDSKQQSVQLDRDQPEMPAKPTILQTLAKAGRFKTLAAALKEADLLSALEAEGPFTVFAPTDRAFAKLGEDTLKTLLADKETLSSILLYHVVPNRVSLIQALYAGKADTLNGAELKFDISGLRPRVNMSNILLANVSTSNGVIHVIDTVLTPPMMQEDDRKDDLQEAQQEGQKEVPEQQIMAGSSIFDVVTSDSRFTTLVDLVRSAGLADALKGEGPFTIFAPTNEAFAALSQETLDLLANDAELLRNILRYHVVPGTAVNASRAFELDRILMANGEEVQVDSTASRVLKINDARVIEADITADNGIIHVIDTVLIP